MEGFLWFIAQLGGSAVIVGVLSTWIGRLWADRILKREDAEHQARLKKLESDLRHQVDSKLAHLESELATLRDKTLRAHADKLACYAFAVDSTAAFMSELSVILRNQLGAARYQSAFAAFDAGRIKAYGHMALVAPQAVMDAYDKLVDYFLLVDGNMESASWESARHLALNWINAVRNDLGVDPTPIEYRGKL